MPYNLEVCTLKCLLLDSSDEDGVCGTVTGGTRG